MLQQSSFALINTMKYRLRRMQGRYGKEGSQLLRIWIFNRTLNTSIKNVSLKELLGSTTTKRPLTKSLDAAVTGYFADREATVYRKRGKFQWELYR